LIYQIRVWERSTGEHQLVGEMVCEIGKKGLARSVFRYNREYFERNDSFAMDPVSLPLKFRTVSTEHSSVFDVFEDSLPDTWGRRLLVHKHQISQQEQNLPNLLLALGSAGLGALSFSDQAYPPLPATDISFRHLSSIIVAAEKYERGENEDAELSLLLSAGCSPGGDRPKVVVVDDKKGIHYLAKFPSINDQIDVVKIEAATMNLAVRAGIDIPHTHLVQRARKSVLLVQRFDITPSGRRHMISFQTLLRAQQGRSQLRYQDLLNIVRKYSDGSSEDLTRLFRQMVFNAIVGNTDNHLKNFWMIHDYSQGWRLSPAFDLVPDLGQQGKHTLYYGLAGNNPGRQKLEKLGLLWRIKNAGTIVEQVFDAVTDWKEEFVKSGVPENDISRFEQIDSYLRE
jgi:serine/threonine-protein kinase HipA